MVAHALVIPGVDLPACSLTDLGWKASRCVVPFGERFMCWSSLLSDNLLPPFFFASTLPHRNGLRLWASRHKKTHPLGDQAAAARFRYPGFLSLKRVVRHRSNILEYRRGSPSTPPAYLPPAVLPAWDFALRAVCGFGRRGGHGRVLEARPGCGIQQVGLGLESLFLVSSQKKSLTGRRGGFIFKSLKRVLFPF